MPLARYRDEYLWLARDHRFSDSLKTRGSLVVTSAERGREGTLLNPGVASGALDETRSFNGVDFSNDWTYRSSDKSTYTFGGAVGVTHAPIDTRAPRSSRPMWPPLSGAATSEELAVLRRVRRC